jgi:hypothetical protein
VEAVRLAAEAVVLAPLHAAEVAMAETQALCVWGHSVAWSGEPAGCTATLEQRRHEANASLDHVSAEVLGVTLGIARMVEGRFAVAAALFDGLRPSANLFSLSWQPYAVAWRALCLARVGRVDDARAVAARTAEGGGDAAHRAFLSLAQAEIDAASTGRAAAAARLDAAAERADERGQVLLALLTRFRAFTLDASDERATAALDAVRRHDGRLASTMAGAIDGWCRRSVPALLDVAGTAEREGLGMLALEVWDLIGATAAAARLPATERDRLQVRQVEARHRLGVEDVGPAAPAAGGLTEREATIARLAAAGWQDKDIASQLGLSVRTVNAHLRTCT